MVYHHVPPLYSHILGHTPHSWKKNTSSLNDQSCPAQVKHTEEVSIGTEALKNEAISIHDDQTLA
jgi:hypothetical protein